MKILPLCLLSLFLPLFLTGCASLSPQTTSSEQSWDSHQEQLSDLDTWTLKGKAAVSSGKEGGTANVIWTQNNEDYHFEMYGLLGHGRTEIVAEDGEVRLHTREGPILVSNDVQAVLGEYTGWYLPVEHLFYWVRGLPAPGPIDDMQLNAQGYLQELQQDGWTITYGDYTQIEGIWLPERFTLSYPGSATEPALSIKWLSKNWEI